MSPAEPLELMEWVVEVRKYAAFFGHYNFSQAERRRMAPFMKSTTIKLLHRARFQPQMHTNLTMVYDLMDELEQGLVEAVTVKLTQ